MAGVRHQGVLVGLLASVMLLVGTIRPLLAETLPTPLSEERAAPSVRPTARVQNPVSELASGLRSLFNLDKQPDARSTTTTGFSPAQRVQVDKVSAYLSSVHQMVGNFGQVGPDGSRMKGEFYMQKPGRVRFEYDPPSPMEIIADGQSVVVRDRKLATQDVYPLSQTPLRFLLSDRIDLLRDTNVVAVRSDDVNVTVVIQEWQALIGTSQLMMVLGAKDYQLKQWTVKDPQGYDTTVAISNLDISKRPDPRLFRLDYARYAQ
jgi:outer membrane lipoprotein-sorting protein